jgi:hypothetical protein
MVLVFRARPHSFPSGGRHVAGPSIRAGRRPGSERPGTPAGGAAGAIWSAIGSDNDARFPSPRRSSHRPTGRSRSYRRTRGPTLTGNAPVVRRPALTSRCRVRTRGGADERTFSARRASSPNIGSPSVTGQCQARQKAALCLFSACPVRSAVPPAAPPPVRTGCLWRLPRQSTRLGGTHGSRVPAKVLPIPPEELRSRPGRWCRRC